MIVPEEFDCEIGARVVVDHADAEKVAAFLYNSVVDIDKRAIFKFKLPHLATDDMVDSINYQSRHNHREVQKWRKNFLAMKKGSK